MLGGEHASTPQSGVEAPRLLKRSLPRLYYCCYCCCCCCCDDSIRCVYLHSIHSSNWQPNWSPPALTAVSARKLEKLALNSGTAGGARKMTQNASPNTVTWRARRNNVQVQSANPREETLQLEASTVHTSPFSGMENESLGSECTTRGKYVKFDKSHS